MSGHETENLGACCCCGRSGADGVRVRTIVMLDKLAPEPGKGWACVVCGLPSNGAIVVICDECAEANAPYRFAVAGRPYENRRVPLSSLRPEPFDHDMSKHPESNALERALEAENEWDEADDWDDDEEEDWR